MFSKLSSLPIPAVEHTHNSTWKYSFHLSIITLCSYNSFYVFDTHITCPLSPLIFFKILNINFWFSLLLFFICSQNFSNFSSLTSYKLFNFLSLFFIYIVLFFSSITKIFSHKTLLLAVLSALRSCVLIVSCCCSSCTSHVIP